MEELEYLWMRGPEIEDIDDFFLFFFCIEFISNHWKGTRIRELARYNVNRIMGVFSW